MAERRDPLNCVTCNKDLWAETVFFMCERDGAFCADHWETIKCEERHGESCGTKVFV